ncbi:MAG: hypothetical protein RR824_08785 [Clostridia bacterium]
MSKMPTTASNLLNHKSISRWDEAIPLGNGLCGALIWGKSTALRFSLDRGDVWDTTPFAGGSSEEYTYATMVRLAKEGNVDEIRRIFDAPYNHPLPTKLPAGKLILDFHCDANVCSALDLATATATLQVKDIQIKSYLHATDKCGFVWVNKPLSAFSYRIENPAYGANAEDADGNAALNSSATASLQLLHYPAPKLVNQDGVCYFIQQISPAFSYGVFVKAVEAAGATTLCFYVGTSNDGADWQAQALALLGKALEAGYERSFLTHAQWWRSYWEESSITLPDAFFEKNWYITNYLLGSDSRRGCYPMPLQGLWTADDGLLPPWKGDYHHDLNTQMSYYSYLKANHLEQGESFIDYLWSMADCARQFAKSFYHADGLCLPSTMSLDGASLGGWGMYSLSPTNQLWLCQAFERHYRFTGDQAFLREKAYPYMRETAIFIKDLLEEKDGLLYLPISSSPEIHDDGIEAFVTPNSNYDLALMRYLFGALVRLASLLENGEQGKWQAVLDKLPPLAVSENGVMRVSTDESLNESHRHFSHAMGIHPLRLLPYEGAENQRIIDATLLDLERLGTGAWVGFSFTWMAELYAIAKNGNGAAYQLSVFWHNCCSINGFHLNGDYRRRGTSTFHYRPFTLEANMCAADALQEMLLQSENGSLTFFPAIPDEWLEETLSFEHFRAENGLLVSAAMQNGVITAIELEPQYSGEIAIQKTKALPALQKVCPMRMSESGEQWILALTGGEKYQIVERNNAHA